MVQRILVYSAADLPLLVLLLLVLLVVSIIFAARERSRMRRSLAQEVEDRVQSELGILVGDILRRSEEARQQLATLSTLETALHDKRSSFETQVASATEEIETILVTIRGVGGEILKLAPDSGDLEWMAPGSLLRLAAQAPDWPTAAGYLARIDRENATSRDLEGAGEICRDRAVYMKALEFYQQATEKDPDNLSARAQLLALTAEMRPSDRAASLKALQELLAQNLLNPTSNPKIQARYFALMTDLGHQKELIEFSEAQLKLPLPRSAQVNLHRHLAVCLHKLGRSEEAMAHCETALKISADDMEALSLYGGLLLWAKKYEDAYRIAIRVLQRNPTSARHYIALARIQERRIGRPAARDLLKRALQWSDANERCEIEDYQSKLSALDELSQVVPATQPQIIQA
jgi:tetratricopeptide (TPR) repeat protein